MTSTQLYNSLIASGMDPQTASTATAAATSAASASASGAAQDAYNAAIAAGKSDTAASSAAQSASTTAYNSVMSSYAPAGTFNNDIIPWVIGGICVIGLIAFIKKENKNDI